MVTGFMQRKLRTRCPMSSSPHRGCNKCKDRAPWWEAPPASQGENLSGVLRCKVWRGVSRLAKQRLPKAVSIRSCYFKWCYHQHFITPGPKRIPSVEDFENHLGSSAAARTLTVLTLCLAQNLPVASVSPM